MGPYQCVICGRTTGRVYCNQCMPTSSTPVGNTGNPGNSDSKGCVNGIIVILGAFASYQVASINYGLSSNVSVAVAIIGGVICAALAPVLRVIIGLSLLALALYIIFAGR